MDDGLILKEYLKDEKSKYNNKLRLYTHELVDSLTVNKIITKGGTSDQIVMGDGSLKPRDQFEVHEANHLTEGATIAKVGTADNCVPDLKWVRGKIDENNTALKTEFTTEKLIVGSTAKEEIVIATINGSLEVKGNITQDGSSYITHAENIYTEDDLIHTRKGAVSSLGIGKLTGIVAEKYDSEKNFGALGFDSNGIARVGDVKVNDAGDLTDISKTQALATRQDSPLSNGIAYWNNTDKRFDTKAESSLSVDSAVNATKLIETELDGKPDANNYVGEDYAGKRWWSAGWQNTPTENGSIEVHAAGQSSYFIQIFYEYPNGNIYFRQIATDGTKKSWYQIASVENLSDYVPVAGETTISDKKTFANGLAITNAPSNDEMPYFLGIDAFSDGGTVKWVSKAATKVGYSDNSGKLNNQLGSYYASTDGTNALSQTATNKALNTLGTGSATKITDATSIITSDDDGDRGTYYRRNAAVVWNWIKDHTDANYLGISSNSVGTSYDGTCTAEAGNSNELNFGGTNTSPTIWFGFRARGSRPLPTEYIFGNNSNGSATVKAKNFLLNGNQVATTSDVGTKVSKSGDTMSGSLRFSSFTPPEDEDIPTALSYGRLQSYGTFYINGNTDNSPASDSEFVLITAGHGLSTSLADGLSIGKDSLKWKGNAAYFNSSGKLTVNNDIAIRNANISYDTSSGTLTITT